MSSRYNLRPRPSQLSQLVGSTIASIGYHMGMIQLDDPIIDDDSDSDYENDSDSESSDDSEMDDSDSDSYDSDTYTNE